MLNRYDAAQAARVDCEFARKYDTEQAAFTDCEFVRAYDATEGAWVDKLYSGCFTLRQDEYTPKLSADDEFIVTKNEVTLFTAKTAEVRWAIFDFPLKWAGETVEFKLVSNGIAMVSLKREYSYGTTTSSGNIKSISESYDGTVTVQLGICPDDEDGQPVTDSKISVEIYVYAENANTDIGYVNISDLKINGKKYGFTE